MPWLIRVKLSNSPWLTQLPTSSAWLLEAPVGHLHAMGFVLLSTARCQMQRSHSHQREGAGSADAPHGKLQKKASFKDKAGGDLKRPCSSTACPKVGSALTIAFLFFNDFQGWIFNNVFGQPIQCFSLHVINKICPDV